MSYGSGEYTYDLVDNWAKLPEDWTFLDVGGLTVDAEDRIYVFNRSPHPVTIHDRDGNFLGSWGEGYFNRPHGSRFDRQGILYCTDDGNHTVSKFTADGKLLQVIGEKGKPADTGYVRKDNLIDSLRSIKAGGLPFNRPTGVDFDSAGNFYVSDGYGNARVHKFSPEGKLLFSWGEPGTGPGEFMLPHNVWIDKYDRVWIPDRENNRIQIFDTNGNLLQIWQDVFRPTDVFIDENEIVYVSEIRPGVSIFTIDGRLLARWCNEEKDPATDLFISCHAIAVDSRGDIYIGDVAWTHSAYDKGAKTVQKFARIK
ncbi:MAG: peptidyl-alpha-hydroxyglycine alpha-amidating lyase family protein [Chloroflexota bacterium]